MSLIFQMNMLAPIDGGGSAHAKQAKGYIEISQLRLGDIDYQMLTACLMSSNILDQALLWPTYPEANGDIMRVCTKLVITLVFKASRRRILMGKPAVGTRTTL